MMRRVLMAALFLTAAACGAPDEQDRVSFAVRVDRPSFDSSRAFEDLQAQVAFGPRVPGTEGHAQQLQWMQELLRGLADTVFVDEFEYTTTAGEELNLTNVTARFGLESDRRLLLLTHWDTRPKADQSLSEADQELPVPGANDGASGTAVLIELARMFAEQAPPGGVDLLFTDGEDYGPTTADMFLGAVHYVEGRGAEDPPDFGVLLDMVGDADPRFPVEAYSLGSAPQLVQRFWGIAAGLGYQRYFPMDETSRVVDDHLKLNDAGIPTIDVIDFDYGPGNALWHTPRDTPDNTSAQTLFMVGEVTAEFVYRNR
jgi:glutaminyl-peptide cyclotransferase